MPDIYFPNISPNIKDIGSQELTYYVGQYDNAATAFWPERQRCLRNVRAYTSLDSGQWSDAFKSEMQREGRNTKQYNFAQFIVDGVAGNYIMNWFDPFFNDREDDNKDVQSAVTALQKKYYSDKKQYDYKSSALTSVRNGLLYCGWEELRTDRKRDVRGSCYFEAPRPDFLIPDMGNTKDDISLNSKTLYKEFLLTAEEMFYDFPDAEGKIKDVLLNQMKVDKGDGLQFERKTLSEEAFSSTPWRRGSKYVVVEWYHFEYEKKRLIIDRKTGKEYPDLGFEFGTEDDFFAKITYGRENGMSANREDMVVMDKKIPILWVTTFCRDFNIVLENRRDERQFDGHMPFYCWSFIQVNGRSVGLMDLILDAQQDLNAREAAKTKIITQTPINGKMWVHPSAYGGTSAKRDSLMQDMTDSSKPFILDDDVPEALAGGLFGIMNGQQLNGAVLQDETMKIEFMSKIGRLPPAMQGFTERSGESGIHLGRKVIEGSVMQLVPMQFLMRKERQKARDWAMMTLRLMGAGDRRNFFANLNRSFTDTTDERIVLNEVTGYDEHGNPQVVNDMRNLSHIEVDISETKENDYVRQLERESSVAALQANPPSPTNDIIRAQFECRVAENMNHATDKDKEDVHRACLKRKELAEKTTELQLINIDVAKANAQLTLQQMNQQMAGGMPPATPGMPGQEPAPGGGGGATPDAAAMSNLGFNTSPTEQDRTVSPVSSVR